MGGIPPAHDQRLLNTHTYVNTSEQSRPTCQSSYLVSQTVHVRLVGKAGNTAIHWQRRGTEAWEPLPSSS